LSKLEIALSPEIAERIDEAVELLGYGSREELVLCVIRRFLDECYLPKSSIR
jgi:metal-responsive CopG/Arc/MetJ family transcriptional regulator